MALTNEPVIVVCYGKEKQYNSRQEAYDYYMQGVLATDGSEQNRYATICSMLQSTNDKVVGDDEYYDKEVSKITTLEKIQEYCNIKNTKAMKKIITFLSERKVNKMTVMGLNKDQMNELKCRYYSEKTDEDLSYSEMLDIDKIVSDEEVINEYADTYFSEDDFTCNSYDKDDVDYEY